MFSVTYPHDPEAAARMVGAALERGGVAVIPTDTVYGLVCLPSSYEAVARVFELKQRPPEVRLPVIVGSTESLAALGISLDDRARRLAGAFWPGALTIAFGVRDPEVEWLVGRDEVGVRIPDSALTTALAELVGPFLMTSANAHGGGTQARLLAVLEDLAGQPDVAVDGGPLDVVSSTLVNLNLPEPRIEREGAIPAAEVLEVLGG
ncbi:MAG TPA: L-threonylcarbamoyladenylate synthase [Gaiellaceae bacterium]|nr:L-threonylcarbamoyladenylate synthase [Gaiellaceae bacterium]